MANDIDRRYTRTHLAIRKAFTNLMLEKEYREITVSEIARLADINRKTFYRHYDSLYSVLDELQEEIMEELAELQTFLATPLGPDHYRNFVRGFLGILSKNTALHRRLFCSGEYSFVFEKIRAVMTGRIVDAFRDTESLAGKDSRLFIDFISYGFVFVVRDWLSAKKPMPVEEFTETLTRLLYLSNRIETGSAG